MDQLYKTTDIVEYDLEENEVSSVVFLDVAQTFDKVCYEGLIQKLNKMLPKQYAQIFTTYISNGLIRIR